MQNFRVLGAPPPDPRASGGWGLCPQTPSLWQLGAPPPDPPNSPPHCEFLATRLNVGSIFGSTIFLRGPFLLHLFRTGPFWRRPFRRKFGAL